MLQRLLPNTEIQTAAVLKLIFLGKSRVQKARAYSDNYKSMVAILEEMTDINMQLLKNEQNIKWAGYEPMNAMIVSHQISSCIEEVHLCEST